MTPSLVQPWRSSGAVSQRTSRGWPDRSYLPIGDVPTPLLPALAGTTMGFDVPQGIAEDSFFDTMVETYDGKQLQA